MARRLEYAEKMTCRRCNMTSAQRVVGTINDTEMHEDPSSGQSWESGTIYQLLICENCGNLTLRGGFWHEGMDDPSEWHPKTIYPADRQVLCGLPADVKLEYEAAQRVSAIAPNAYAVLLGRVIDSVCVDRSASGESLYDRLNDLAGNQEIPVHLADMAHQLRQLRNVGAHADLGSLTEAEIPVLEALCKAILEYVYEAPRLLKAVETRLDEIRGTRKKARSSKSKRKRRES